MAEILVQVKKWLTPSKINIENFTSRLFYQITFGFCLGGFLILFGFQYFGSPIGCKANGKPVSASFLDHCWMHGTSLIIDKPDLEENARCLLKDNELKEKIKKELKDEKLTYYQWIVFILLLNGVIFRIPHTIWKIFERGHIRGFYSEEANSASIHTNDDLRNELLNRFSNLFNQLQGLLRWYHITFVVCQLLNFLLVLIMFKINDLFLNGKFSSKWSYGVDSISRKGEPMCLTFPTQTSCNQAEGGSGGDPSTDNARCLLNQNIVNQYIFLILWFWFAALSVIGFLQLVFETFTVIPQFRVWLIKRELTPLADENTEKGKAMLDLIKGYLNDLEIGDWFLLYQISKNMDKRFFCEFIKTVSTDPQSEERMSLHDVEANTNPIDSEEN